MKGSNSKCYVEDCLMGKAFSYSHWGLALSFGDSGCG